MMKIDHNISKLLKIIEDFMNKLLQGHDKILSKSSSLKNIISQLENNLVLYYVGRTIVLFKSMSHGMSANNLKI